MPFRIRLICLFLLLSFFLYAATDVDKKKKELSTLKKQIQLNKQKAAASEKKKKAALHDKKIVEKHLKETKNKVFLLKNTEKTLSKNLSLTKQMISQTDNRLTDSYHFGNDLLVNLLRMHNNEKYGNQVNTYKYPMALMINHTSNIVSSLSLQKLNLENEENKKTREVKSVQFKSLLENQKAQKYSLQSNQINNQIKSLENERLKYLSQAKKLEKSARNLESLIVRLTPKASEKKKYTYKFVDGLLNWPAKGKIIKHYGLQTHAKYNIQTISNGIDIALPFGSTVKASADGQVVYSDNFSGSAMMIIIDHKNGFHTVYSYNSQLLVSKDTHVKKGQNIALSGNSPSDESSALHFEIRKNGKPVNPANYLK